jgi:hypothetical protein
MYLHRLRQEATKSFKLVVGPAALHLMNRTTVGLKRVRIVARVRDLDIQLTTHESDYSRIGNPQDRRHPFSSEKPGWQ